MFSIFSYLSPKKKFKSNIDNSDIEPYFWLQTTSEVNKKFGLCFLISNVYKNKKIYLLFDSETKLSLF